MGGNRNGHFNAMLQAEKGRVGVQQQNGEMKRYKTNTDGLPADLAICLCKRKEETCEMERVHSKELRLLMFLHIENTFTAAVSL